MRQWRKGAGHMRTAVACPAGRRRDLSAVSSLSTRPVRLNAGRSPGGIWPERRNASGPASSPAVCLCLSARLVAEGMPRDRNRDRPPLPTAPSSHSLADRSMLAHCFSRGCRQRGAQPSSAHAYVCSWVRSQERHRISSWPMPMEFVRPELVWQLRAPRRVSSRRASHGDEQGHQRERTPDWD